MTKNRRKKRIELEEKKKQYEQALSAMHQKDYPAALLILKKIEDYQESRKLFQECIDEYRKVLIEQLAASNNAKIIAAQEQLKQATQQVDLMQKKLNERTNEMQEAENRKNEKQKQIYRLKVEISKFHGLFFEKKKQMLQNELAVLEKEKAEIERQQHATETELTKAQVELQEAKNALAQAQITMKAVEKPNAAQLCWSEKEIMREIAAQPGKYITFGHYPQTSEGKDKTPIEWLILERDGLNALVVSKYGLDAQPYNISYTDVTWEKCSLRTWLNDTFYNKAFNADAQAAILTTNVDNSKNQGDSEYSTNGGNNTMDKVFLLSYAEADRHFDIESWNDAALIEPTAYAIAQGAEIYDDDDDDDDDDDVNRVDWWLRSPGYSQNKATIVDCGGASFVDDVSDTQTSVRPAMWVNLEALIFQA